VAFDLVDAKTGYSSIWQSDRTGKNAEPIRPTAASGKVQTHGRWTKDGSYFLYDAGTPEDHDLWAVRDPNDRLRLKPRPLRMTRGPLNWTWPTPGSARKDVFALGEQVSTELVYFDRKASTWRPYRASFPAYEVDFSRDGKWMAYTRYPEHTVWSARIDGSEPVRLTSPSFEAHQPHWSPDGREIALMARTGADPWRIFTVPANGGGFSPLTGPLKDAEDRGVPTWSKDGHFIVYGDWLYSRNTPMKIHLFDRVTSRVSALEGSESLWTPRWSPDGRYISAFRQDLTGLMLTMPGVSLNWRQIVRGKSLDNMMWSPDSRYVYFRGPSIRLGLLCSASAFLAAGWRSSQILRIFRARLSVGSESRRTDRHWEFGALAGRKFIISKARSADEFRSFGGRFVLTDPEWIAA